MVVIRMDAFEVVLKQREIRKYGVARMQIEEVKCTKLKQCDEEYEYRIFDFVDINDRNVVIYPLLKVRQAGVFLFSHIII